MSPSNALPVSRTAITPADSADKLQPAARERLLDLRYGSRAANLLLRDLGDEVRDLQEQKVRAETHMRDMTSGRYANVPKEQLARQQAAIDALAEKISGLQARYNEAQARWLGLQRPVQAIEGYLQDVSRDSLTMAPALPEPKLLKGEIAPDAVQRVRAEIDKLRVELQMVETAPIPSSTVKERMRAQIAALVEAGRPDVVSAIEGGGKIRFQEKYVGDQFVQGGASGTYVPGFPSTDVMALLAWMHGDQLIAALDREIDENSDDASALDDVTRAKKSKQFKAQILAVEREEEAIIGLAHQHGLLIHRRPDADPRAILGINGPEPRQ